MKDRMHITRIDRHHWALFWSGELTTPIALLSESNVLALASEIQAAIKDAKAAKEPSR